jgi:sugar transferase EpsL
MSVVGPRPLMMRYLPRYNKFQARRMEMKPGVTGWAQINGRNALSWDEKFALDVWYIDNSSFWLDLKIVVKTFFVVLNRRNINSSKAATMEEFWGDTK